MEEAAVALIICGLGGIGKSTLAKAYIQSLLPSLTGKYKYARVEVDNTVKQGKQAHIASLQQQILSKVSQNRRNIPNPEEGRHALRQVLGKHSCLLLIENVNDPGIINQLLPKYLSLDSGVMLRIIITSRDPHVKVEVPSCCVPKICERQRLPDELAMQLLKSIVLGSTSHELRFPEEMEKLNMIAQLCHGIPLLLTVVGGQLSQERVKSSYDQFIEKLQMGNVNFETINHEEIKDILFFAFKRMETSLQEAFRDICCCLLPGTWDLRLDRKLRKWKHLCWMMGENTMNDMKNKGLAKPGQDGEITVHDILKIIANKESQKHYILEPSEWQETVKDRQALRAIMGIRIRGDTVNCTDLYAAHCSVRLLHLKDVNLIGQDIQKFNDLKSISLISSDCFVFKRGGSFQNLRFLYLRSATFKDLPVSSCDIFPNLSVLSLQDCENLEKLPHDFGVFKAMKCLKIYSCEKLTELPESMGGLESLKEFRLRQCSLEKLPSQFSQLTSLDLCKFEFTNLKQLPPGICSSLISLSRLCLIGNNELRALPQDFGGLQSLCELKIIRCPIEELPSSFCRLSSLEICILMGTKLKLLQPGICNGLSSLRELRLVQNDKLRHLPQDFGGLQELKELLIWECPIQELPSDFTKLSFLEVCELEETNLRNFPCGIFNGLTSLRHLSLKENNQLQALPEDFGRLQSLKWLSIYKCPIEELPLSFSMLTSLEECYLEYTNLKEIPWSISSRLSSLKKLFLVENNQLKASHEDIERLLSLTIELLVQGCPMVES